jgi:Amt family ammonium transporter
VEWLSFGRPSTLGLISGAIAGLVGITPASGTAGVLGALCIGGVTGVVTFFASTKLKEAIDLYDDALDAFGLHAIGGITGALLTGVWCAPALGGVGFGTLVRKGGRETQIGNIGFQLGIQACSVAFALVWVSLGTLLALKATDMAHGGRNWGLRLRAIRVSAEVESVGLDEAQFAEQARRLHRFINAEARTALLLTRRAASQGYNFMPSDLRISVEVRRLPRAHLLPWWLFRSC